MTKKIITIAVLLLTLSSCEMISMLGGFFYSYSTPDERFAASSSMSYDSDPSTLAALGSEYQFIVFSDIQGQDNQLNQLLDVIDLDTGLRVAEDSFIIDLGDSTEHGYEEEYSTYKNLMDSTGIPWFQTIGNHDLYNRGWDNYRKVLGKTSFTIEIGTREATGSMLLISLDSANSTIGKKQMEWLERTLAEESGHWDHLVVFSHSQFFSDPILTVVQFTDTEEIYKLISLFKKYNVDIMFAGHTHVWNYRTLGGTEYITIPPLEKAASEDSIVRVFVTGSDLRWEKVYVPEVVR